MRRETSHSGGDDAYLFQPRVNYRTLGCRYVGHRIYRFNNGLG